MTWREEAACNGLPNVLFYPPIFKEERTAPERRYYHLGKLACEVCPVQRECRRDGEDEEFGLWGGLTPRERGMGSGDITDPKPHSKILPAKYTRLLASMGDSPDVVALYERIKEFLEKRPKQ